MTCSWLLKSFGMFHFLFLSWFLKNSFALSSNRRMRHLTMTGTLSKALRVPVHSLLYSSGHLTPWFIIQVLTKVGVSWLDLIFFFMAWLIIATCVFAGQIICPFEDGGRSLHGFPGTNFQLFIHATKFLQLFSQWGSELFMYIKKF